MELTHAAEAASDALTLSVNGEPRRVAARTVAALLAELGHAGGHVAVAVNEDVVRRSAWGEAALRDGDRVEVVTPRQGG